MKHEAILEWDSPQHYFNRKTNDWYWILGVIVVGASVLAFYFGNFLFGVFIIIAGLTIGMLSYRETKKVSVKITPKGIIFGRSLYPWISYKSFWIEDEHINGPRILLYPAGFIQTMVTIPINDEVDLNDVRDVLLEFLEEEFLTESIFHKWFDKIISK
ncbi:MAG: hypothetical protein GX627_01455 [Parcubacteria group bacterium]|jgi:hypothetical protein|nr:hypothetical protein [Parcubacteria group bacterium]